MSKKLIFSLAILAAAVYYGRRCGKLEGKTVETKTGTVKGIISYSRDGREYFEWLGIPYAKPPVGQLRFASPLPVERWQGILDASEYGSKCSQLEALSYRPVGSEDCLFVNVHVPKLNSEAKLPVMVSIHGGGFNLGSSNDYRPDYFMDEDVILVTINYRLGAFGFLSTGDASIRGNMGLKDQVLALKWIKDNIEAFGGDSNKITIFGESAGGASVHYLLLSEQTKGLFNKAIAQSGVATVPWGFDTTESSKSHAKKLASKLGCPVATSDELVTCMRKLSGDEILQATKEDVQFDFVTHPEKTGKLIHPTVETVKDAEAFLTEHPFEIVKKGKASRVPWMTGNVEHEGLLSSVEFYKDDKYKEEFESNFDEMLAVAFGVSLNSKVAKKIRDYYFPPDIKTPEDKRQQFTNMFSDSHFNLQMERMVQTQKNFSPVYLYHYSKRGGPSLAPLLAGIKGDYPLKFELLKIVAVNFFNEKLFGEMPRDYGVCHGDDLAMQFYMPFIFNVKKDSQFYKFSKDVVAFWADFARDESAPKFRGVEVPVQKPKEKLQYLEINDSPKVITAPFQQRLDFLRSLNLQER